MTLHVHHWDSMMVFEETTKSLFTSNLFIPSGDNKPVTSDDLSANMVDLYRGAGIFASEEPVRQTTKRLVDLSLITWYSQCMVLVLMVLFFQNMSLQ